MEWWGNQVESKGGVKRLGKEMGTEGDIKGYLYNNGACLHLCSSGNLVLISLFFFKKNVSLLSFGTKGMLFLKNNIGYVFHFKFHWIVWALFVLLFLMNWRNVTVNLSCSGLCFFGKFYNCINIADYYISV